MASAMDDRLDDPHGGAINFTCGIYRQTGPWLDRRAMSWSELALFLTEHSVGAKEGTCFVPAIFEGTERKKEHAKQIDIAVLDSDSGARRDEIRAAVEARGWRALISSTHSHGTTRTRVSRVNWLKLLETTADPVTAAEQFLIQEKGFLPRVAAGAHIVAEDDKHITFAHQPCPKFRVVLLLHRPWRATDYPNQAAANAVWKERIEAVAAALNLDHDQSCTDTSRLFYLPRRPADGPPAETAVIDGKPCDIFALPAAPPTSDAGTSSRPSGDAGCETDKLFIHTDAGGAEFDLYAWVKEYGHRFEIVDALKARHPEAFVGHIVDVHKHHIRCPNEDAHTNAGEDHATFCVNASASTSRKGFVIHCRHAHCTDRDRLLFLGQMLEQEWLRVADLTDEAFLSPPTSARPLIRYAPGTIVEVVDAAEQALVGANADIYQRGHFLVRPATVAVAIRNGQTVDAQHIVEVGDHALAEELSKAAQWEKTDQRSKGPVTIDAPLKVAITYKQRIGRWRVPTLMGVINAPTLRPDGSILEADGYDPATGLLLDTLGVAYPAIPSNPSKLDALMALQILCALLVGFPFVNTVSKAVALSCILSACIRRSLPTVPMHGYTAPTPGSGKSLLVDLACLIAAGREAGIISQGRTAEELEKRLGALLLAGDLVVAIDNCEEPLGGDFLCAMLTQPTVRVRVLGRSEAPELPSNSLVTATGNNLRLVGDMTRRAVLCQLDPGMERPELRTFSFEPDRMIKADRGRYLIAALTILRAYHVAGRPDRPPPLASYGDWSDWVRGALIWLGQADPVESVEEVRSLDPARNGLLAVMTQWQAVIGERVMSVGDLIEIACLMRMTPPGALTGSSQEFINPELREALLEVAGIKGVINNIRLGKWLANNKGRVVEGRRITSQPMSRGIARWSLEVGAGGTGHE